MKKRNSTLRNDIEKQQQQQKKNLIYLIIINSKNIYDIK